MKRKHNLRLQWRLFFPLVGLLWLIIGITITYFVRHEQQRQKENLENRLLNVNKTVIAAYERGVDLQETVNFIRLFTDHTTLSPLRITVYDDKGAMIADNPAATISLYDNNGKPNAELQKLWNSRGNATVYDMAYDDCMSMISSNKSSDGHIHSFAALPYKGEVRDFLSIDPMVWGVVIVLGILSSVLAFLGARAMSRNVYTLRNFAQAIASDKLPDDIESWQFSKDELGDVSRNLLTLYQDKIHAEHEKMHHERQIGMSVSHELKTPVGIIKGYLDSVLADNDMPEELKQKFLLRAQRDTNRLADLINDVSMVMRLQENGMAVECTEFNFHHLAERLSEDVVQGHLSDNMSFAYNVPENCRVIGHESLLINAMLNLIYNAVQYSEGTEMSLSWLHEENGMHIFAFADNGVGVEPEHLHRLFDLFYRVDGGRSRKNGGSGLGLPLVHRIINALGGDITVENKPSGGLCFTFSLRAAL